VGKDADDAVHTMLMSALGCNLAWGIIDAVLYLIGCMAEKSRGLMRLHAVRNTTDAQEAQRLIADGLPSAITAILQPAELESMHQRLKQLPEPPKRAHLRKDEWLGALAVFLWVFLITFPVAIPFMFMHSVAPALLVSNGIGIVLLFGLGYAYGHITARNPWFRGVVMVIVGGAMVALCRAVGG
jgi:VIT1/CCC1 family predicted Fe2+/Mn2+ transporter